MRLANTSSSSVQSTMRVSVVAAMRASSMAAMRVSPVSALRSTTPAAICATPAARLQASAPVETRSRLRKKLFGHHDQGMLPRMSWNVHNLYNILNRTFNPRKRSEIYFNRSNGTVYQQRFKAKRFARGYHGDWIQERRFKRYLVPLRLPSFNPIGTSQGLNKGAREKANVANQAVDIGGYQVAQAPFSAQRNDYASDTLLTSADDQPPMAQLYMRDVERGLDVVVFRACFASSVYKARSLILGGHVKLNGVVVTNPGLLLEPGDLVQVAPSRIPFLRYTEKQLQKLKGKEQAADEVYEEFEETSQEKEVEEEAKAEAAADEAGKSSEDQEAAAQAASSEMEAVREELKEEKLEKAEKEADRKVKAEKDPLPKGVRPFTPVPFAASFLFVPPHLEVSWATCSVIFMRYPTIMARKEVARRPGSGFRNRTTTGRQGARESLLGSSEVSSKNIKYETDIGSPFPAAGDIYKLSWEWYQSNAPRMRGQLRRVRLMGKAARHGLVSSRADEAFHLTRALVNNNLVERHSTNVEWLHKMREQHQPKHSERMLTKRQLLNASLAQRALARANGHKEVEEPKA